MNGSSQAYKQSASRREITRQIVSRVLLIAMSLFYISPIYWMLVTALKSDPELSQFPPTLWPHESVWKNFDQATKTFPFLSFLGNTIFYSVFVMAGGVFSNFLIAYGFSRVKRPRRGFFFFPGVVSL